MVKKVLMLLVIAAWSVFPGVLWGLSSTGEALAASRPPVPGGTSGPSGPFGTDWAKSTGQSGTQIERDRRRGLDRGTTQQPAAPCQPGSYRNYQGICVR